MVGGRDTICSSCGTSNNRKKRVQCALCSGWLHMSCVGLTRAQASVIARWVCVMCRGRGTVDDPQEQPNQPLNLEEYVGSCRSRLRVLNKIPRGAVISVAGALRRLLQEALSQRSELTWTRLMSFCYWGLQCPDGGREARQVSLATKIKQQVAQFLETDSLPTLPEPLNPIAHRHISDDDKVEKLRKRVAAKFADGDVSGAVRELSSSDGLAKHCEETVRALRLKHPPAPRDLLLPEPPDNSLIVPVVSEEDVRKAINSFRPGSAGGPDGLRPGHLKTLLSLSSAEAGVTLLTTLTDFVNAILRGEVPDFAVSTFFGATLCALTKKDGGIRPIAVGNTLRRLAAKVGARPLSHSLGSELRPVQLGYSTKGGCEAAAHSARRYLRNCNHRRVFLKVDMKNAFNCLRRDTFLTVIRNRVPELFRFMWQAYSSSSALFFGEEVLRSETGIQQGDPFGPAMFALGIDEVARRVQSEFNVWYLDDAALGDTPERVLEDVRILIDGLSAIGLEVNSAKCELTILDDAAPAETELLFRAVLPNVRVVHVDNCSLLGAPISDTGIPAEILRKKDNLDLMVSRLQVVDNHQAFVLLRNAFSIPKLQYVLRSSPAYKHDAELGCFDESLKSAIASVTNVEMSGDSWAQASLPVCLGGLGCRKAGDIALPAFVSSMNSVSNLVEAILSNVNVADTDELAEAVESWKRGLQDDVPVPVHESSQKEWDTPRAHSILESLLARADQVERARLLSASLKETGVWLNAIPVPSLGTQLTPEVLRVAIALRVGAKVCEAHSCRCGIGMDVRGLHGLSCRYSSGRHPRHAAMNDVVKRALQRAGLPSVLEPPGLDRGDGKRPDGITVFPYRNGKSLIWDCTCVDTFAETHLNDSAVEAGSAAGAAEIRKRQKYSALGDSYIFEPIAIETSGAYGRSTSLIMRSIGRRLVETTSDPRESAWFQQRMALAIQRGNAFSILSAAKESF